MAEKAVVNSGARKLRYRVERKAGHSRYDSILNRTTAELVGTSGPPVETSEPVSERIEYESPPTRPTTAPAAADNFSDF